jgi:hypothetical protein
MPAIRNNAPLPSDGGGDESDAQEIRGGTGIRISRYGDEVVLAAARSPKLWAPAWSVAWGATFVTVGWGTVNEVEPVVGGKPISGDLAAKDPQPPRIPIDKNSFDKSGRAWLCLKVAVDEKTGKMVGAGSGGSDGKDAPTIEILSEARGQRVSGEQAGDGGRYGWHVLAVVMKTGVVHQVTYFPLQHAAIKPVIDGIGNRSKAWQHFFW